MTTATETPSELTRQAREALANLRGRQLQAMDELRERSDGTLYFVENNYNARTCDALVRKRLIARRGEPGSPGSGSVFTDLGREVTRLIREGV